MDFDGSGLKAITRGLAMIRIGSGKAQGLSLLETLIAFFLLTVASLLIVVLFHSGLHRSRAVHDQTQARIIAGDVMDSVRSEATDGGFKEPADLSGSVALTPTQSIHNSTSICWPIRWNSFHRVQGDESAFPSDQRSSLKSSVAKIEVRVSWSNGSQSLSLVSLIGEAPKTLSQVNVTGSGPLSAGASTEFSAVATDTDGLEIEDMKFVWWVEPISATGTIVPARHSRTAVLTNLTRTKDGTAVSTVGLCRIAVWRPTKDRRLSAIRQTSSWNRSGFTLLEVLVSLALLGLAIGLLSKLAIEYNRVLSFADNKDRRAVVAQALESMSTAVSESREIVEPALGVRDGDRLVLRGVVVDSPSRLQRWSFQPDGPELLLNYGLEGPNLIRGSNLAEDQVVAGEIAGFLFRGLVIPRSCFR